MQISIRHELSLNLGTGNARALQHLLLSALSGPTQKVKAWKIEMPGIESAARFTDAFGNQAHLISQVKPEGDISIVVTGEVETIDRHGVVGRMTGDPVPALFKRITPLTKWKSVV